MQLDFPKDNLQHGNHHQQHAFAVVVIVYKDRNNFGTLLNLCVSDLRGHANFCIVMYCPILTRVKLIRYDIEFDACNSGAQLRFGVDARVEHSCIRVTLCSGRC